MKKIILLLLLFGGSSFLFAQHLSFQSSKTDSLDAKTLFERITSLEKKTEKLNIFLNTQGSFNAYPNGNDTEQATFKMDQLRIEVKGNINKWIFYRYRQRLNRSNNPQVLDNLPTSIDYAAIGFQITPKFSFFAGKQSTVYGGIEFDLNPIEVYQYCDMLEYMQNFLTGVDFAYWIADNHELQFQIVDSRNGSFEEMFGQVDPSIKPAKTPLGYTLNWNGSFLENMINTRWSVSVFHDATNKNMYYYALGNQLNLKRFQMYFDFMYSREELDRKGIISRMGYKAGFDNRALNTRYMSLVAHFNYRIRPKINIFLKGMYETASVTKSNQEYVKGKYSTSWGYIGGIEYYPMRENLHFFLTYVGRSFDYTPCAKTLGMSDSNPQRISAGLIYQIPIF